MLLLLRLMWWNGPENRVTRRHTQRLWKRLRCAETGSQVRCSRLRKSCVDNPPSLSISSFSPLSTGTKSPKSLGCPRTDMYQLWLHHLLALWPQASYLVTSSLSFPIFKMWIMILSNSQDCCITWHSSKCLAYAEILMKEIRIKTTKHSSKHFTCINSSKYRNSVTEIVLLFQFFCCCCWVSKLCPHSTRPHGLQHARLLCPPLSPRVFSDSGPLSQWCYLTISSSATPFFFCLLSFPASGSFPMSQIFVSGSQSIGASASAAVLLMNIQG